MSLTSKISPYDETWPTMFVTERDRISRGFRDELIEIYHIGSTSVPGLAAKPEIDVLVEVSEHRNQNTVEDHMRSCGYVRGNDLSSEHHFYRRDVDGVRTHKVHICTSGHWQIDRMIGFRDLLRTNATIRQQYQSLKLRLEANNKDGIGEYLAQKAPFIDELMGPKPSAAIQE